jgi:hypothetical protein
MPHTQHLRTMCHGISTLSFLGFGFAICLWFSRNPDDAGRTFDVWFPGFQLLLFVAVIGSSVAGALSAVVRHIEAVEMVLAKDPENDALFAVADQRTGSIWWEDVFAPKLRKLPKLMRPVGRFCRWAMGK